MISSRPKILNPKGIQLPPQAGEILQTTFGRYQRLMIENEPRNGFSGGRIFVVSPFKGDEAELPAVIKIGPAPLIEQEWQAYQGHIRNRLRNAAQIQDLVYTDDRRWAGIRYTLVGDGVFERENLGQYLGRAEVDPEKAIFTIRERLFSSMEPLWQAHADHQNLLFRDSYDRLLPVNLVIRPVDGVEALPAGEKVICLTPETVAHLDLSGDDYVSLAGFEIIEVDPNEAVPGGQVVTLSRPSRLDGQPNLYRLRLQLTAAQASPKFQVGRQLETPLIGQITATRTEMLRKLAEPILAEAIDLTRKTVPLTVRGTTIALPNPLSAWPDILNRRFDVRMAHTIHGDLNLQNILVDPQTGDVDLIDFADARRDHVLHDFLRLETGVVTQLLPQALSQAGLPPESIYAFYEHLHGATFQAKPAKPALLPPALEKPFTILKTIRQTARHYLFNSGDHTEYYQGLTIYLLGALKFRSLDRRAKRVAFWGAAEVQALVTEQAQLIPRRKINSWGARRNRPATGTNVAPSIQLTA